jgi:hypothetical protein
MMPGAETVHTDKLKENDRLVFERARTRSEDTFTLVGQDLSSPKLICLWIAENIETAPMHKLIDALQHALVMRATLHRKHAD